MTKTIDVEMRQIHENITIADYQRVINTHHYVGLQDDHFIIYIIETDDGE